MQWDEYQRVFDAENEHWWYDGLHALAAAALAQHAAPGARVLDAGCGTGGFLRTSGPADAFGVDIHPEALRLARAASPVRVARASVEGLPFADGSFDAVVSLDVLYHRLIVEPAHVMAEFARVLRPGGVVVLNLPAYEWLRSGHDVAIHTARRFIRAQVRRMLSEARLDPITITHWNSALLPLAAAVRILRRNRRESDLKPPHPLLNRLFRLTLAVERQALRCVPLPFGLSVFAVARKG